MPRYKVLGVDPGEHVGLAVWTHWRDSVEVWEFHTVTGYTAWDYLCERDDWTHVVCENFQSAGFQTRDGQTTLRLIGGIIAICRDRGYVLTLQPPQKRLAFVDEAKALVHARGQEHAISATAHLLAWKASCLKDGALVIPAPK